MDFEARFLEELSRDSKVFGSSWGSRQRRASHFRICVAFLQPSCVRKETAPGAKWSFLLPMSTLSTNPASYSRQFLHGFIIPPRKSRNCRVFWPELTKRQKERNIEGLLASQRSFGILSGEAWSAFPLEIILIPLLQGVRDFSKQLRRFRINERISGATWWVDTIASQNTSHTPLATISVHYGKNLALDFF